MPRTKSEGYPCPGTPGGNRRPPVKCAGPETTGEKRIERARWWEGGRGKGRKSHSILHPALLPSRLSPPLSGPSRAPGSADGGGGGDGRGSDSDSATAAAAFSTAAAAAEAEANGLCRPSAPGDGALEEKYIFHVFLHCQLVLGSCFSSAG